MRASSLPRGRTLLATCRLAFMPLSPPTSARTEPTSAPRRRRRRRPPEAEGYDEVTVELEDAQTAGLGVRDATSASKSAWCLVTGASYPVARLTSLACCCSMRCRRTSRG